MNAHAPPPLLALTGRVHSSSEDNICVEYKSPNSSIGKSSKPRLWDFLKHEQTNQPADKADFRRTRLPSFKIHEECVENLERIKQFKADNQLTDVKRNRTNSLEI